MIVSAASATSAPASGSKLLADGRKVRIAPPGRRSAGQVSARHQGNVRQGDRPAPDEGAELSATSWRFRAWRRSWSTWAWARPPRTSSSWTPAIEELGRITGQRPAMRRARKSIAAFKLRQGMPIAATVTLRGDRMYEFLDRLFNVALPRVRDFRGRVHERLRRPRELHPGPEGPDHLPRGRLRQGGQAAGDERDLRDDGPDGRGVAGSSSSTSACRSGISRGREWRSCRSLPRPSGSRSSRSATTRAAASAAGLGVT